MLLPYPAHHHRNPLIGHRWRELRGNAQGFRFEGPGQNPGVAVTKVGNADAGRLTVDRPKDNDGTLSGTFRGDSAREWVVWRLVWSM